MLPILYSFRRCPYAMRARMAIKYNNVSCELREVVLKNKPSEMLAASPKGTVPVLLDGTLVIDESIDVMAWAIRQNSTSLWDINDLSHPLVKKNDQEFKCNLDRYKYFDRFPEQTQSAYFLKTLEFLEELEASLSEDQHGVLSLLSNGFSAVDIAIMPFIRQLAFVDKAHFDAQSLPKLQAWLEQHLQSDLFHQVMEKYPAWSSEQVEPVLFAV